MADSVSKMVTPSEIFGIPMFAASRNAPPVHGSLDKNVFKDNVESIPVCSLSSRKAITSLERITSLSDSREDSVSWDSSKEGHDECTKSLASTDHCQEVAKQDQLEPLYYILARTGGSSESSINTNAGDSIPLMLMGRQRQAKNSQTIAFSMSSTSHVQSSTLHEEKDQKLPQNVLPQVVAMVPNLPQSTEHTDGMPSYRQFQQQPSDPTVTRRQASLDPQWLKALANLLHLHVTNSGSQSQGDSSDSRLIPDEQLISSLASSTMDTSTMDGLSSSGYPHGLGSNSHTDKYGVSTVRVAPRSALAEIQPLGIAARATENLNTKETQTLPRVLPQYATKRQLVFVSPLMTHQDAKPKPGDSGVLKDCPSFPSGKESDLCNWTSTDDTSMDTSDQNSQEVNDRDDTFNSECTPPECTALECTPKGSQYLRSDFKGRSSKTTRGAINKSDSVLSIHSSDENNQRDNGSQCTMEASKTNSENELSRKTTTPKVETMKSPTFSASPILNVEEARTVREKHNLKERKRRARIKEACDLMRQIVPGMSQKTDKATVFEFSARYIHFLKSQLGSGKDKDFLLKYSPY